MTNKEAIEMMKAKLECMTREVSGRDAECNSHKYCEECDLCYAQGNMGEQKEWLRMGIEALENQKTGHWIDVTNGRGGHKCDNCHEYAPSYQSGNEYLTKYCPNCGAKMELE